MSDHGHNEHASNHDQQFFDKTFVQEERESLMAEDSEAWNGVTSLLLFIVTLGVCLMTGTVLIGR